MIGGAGAGGRVCIAQQGIFDLGNHGLGSSADGITIDTVGRDNHSLGHFRLAEGHGGVESGLKNNPSTSLALKALL